MTKYSEEFKLMVVQEYLSGSLGYRAIAKKYGIADSPLRRWVRAYKEFGRNGISVKKTKQFYSVQFKIDVLNFMKRTGASYQDTAIHFNLNDPTLVASWYHRFLKEGIEGLQKKSKGRPSMSKKPKSTVNQEKIMSREEQLERENELLRLEVAYLKKLKAFRENPNAFLEKLKQPSPSNLNKKDSD
ncbi:helix-turn-helix domain-containing protein [Lysinibacillus sp. SGAir0095]|uniref:helix-turn-helix domain-containing protein n=1 Tax=Lysinibacillus sp. SGAir0095 TaxID=2070463 RepID=UPI0010CD31C7|nr:helix-turn-helix domain-containing protein [Lysinibacillus sp. SGAir0095]QCR31961.1 transposase [Lysinibacillus sp. SGAir0095]QCR33446.1 transposase [Lysinibacillus sp. SGAir0095]